MTNTTRGSIIQTDLASVINGYPARPCPERQFDVPVTVDHHPRVQARVDRWFGHGRRVADFASVYTGEALSVGIVHDGPVCPDLAIGVSNNEYMLGSGSCIFYGDVAAGGERRRGLL